MDGKGGPKEIREMHRLCLDFYLKWTKKFYEIRGKLKTVGICY